MIPINNFLDTSKNGTLWYDENNNIYVTINNVIVPITNNVSQTNSNNYKLLASFTVPYPISNLAIDPFNYIHILTNNGGIGYLYAYNLDGSLYTSTTIGSSGSTPASGLALIPVSTPYPQSPQINIAVCSPNTNTLYGLLFSPTLYPSQYIINATATTGTTPNNVIVLPDNNIAVANSGSGNISLFNSINLELIQTITLIYSNIANLTYDTNSNIYVCNPGHAPNQYYAPSYTTGNPITTLDESFNNIILKTF
ncbi:MAG: hypothetical protein QXI16_00110, partial [Sulfolobaceae archaeon]